MGKESFLNSNNWVSAELDTPVCSDYKLPNPREFKQMAKISDGFVKKTTLDAGELFGQDVTGSDSIIVVSVSKKGSFLPLVAIDNQRGREVFCADMITVFVNPDKQLAKIAICEGARITIKTRPNINQVTTTPK